MSFNLNNCHPIQCLQEPFVRSLASYHFHGATCPFDRRVTCLEWHPTRPTTLAAASKGGDLYLWDYMRPAKANFIQGVSSCAAGRAEGDCRECACLSVCG